MSANTLGQRADLEQRAKAIRKTSTISITFILKQLQPVDATTINKEAIIHVLGNVIQKADMAVEVVR